MSCLQRKSVTLCQVFSLHQRTYPSPSPDEEGAIIPIWQRRKTETPQILLACPVSLSWLAVMLGLKTKSDSLGVGLHCQSPQIQAAGCTSGAREGFAASESQGFRAQGGDFGISNTDRRQSKEHQGNRCVPATEGPPSAGCWLGETREQSCSGHSQAGGTHE